MPDFTEFLPLVSRTIDEIRVQVDGDANAGIDPTDDRYADTAVGGWFYDVTQTLGLEIERLWDFLGSEVPAAGMLPYAFGSYLDDWGDALNVPRKDEVAATGVARFTAPEGTLIASDTQVAQPQADADADPVTFKTTEAGTVDVTGVIDIPIEAVDPGAAGNVPAGAISLIFSPAPGVTAVTNPVQTLGGADVETDEQYRARLLLEFRGAQGSGTVADYQRWALAYPGVGFASVEPIWNGPGTVRIVITSAANDPVPPETSNGLQARLDPVAGQGRGDAPIGHTVTVATPAQVNVTISATVTHSPGYTLDGAGGTIATHGALEAALQTYVDGLAPGDDVVLNRVESLFFGVEGVYDVALVKINGAAADLAIAPLQVASYQPAVLT